MLPIPYLYLAEDETPMKRRLTKQKSKRKKNAWKKPFKQLQKKQQQNIFAKGARLCPLVKTDAMVSQLLYW